MHGAKPYMIPRRLITQARMRGQFFLRRPLGAILIGLVLVARGHAQESSAGAAGTRQSKITGAEIQRNAANHRYTNRLIHSTSPYLLLHAHNPVDWYPWGDEAFEKARKENKPIFLSIGYFTCHWCHVMERESYSDQSVAAILNSDFVSIKVDREERPDIDRLYIAYVEATTGSAGWPLNVLLTPDRKPFFGATYYTPDQLKSLLQQVVDAWKKEPNAITQTAGRAAQQLMLIVNQQSFSTADLEPAVLDKAYERIASTYDATNGGFGGAPKFPRPVSLCFLLRYYVRTGRKEALGMTLNTLQAMERGGIHDQLGGGFHRYSTGTSWLVPHFEKMLYDQAQLAITYTEAYQITHDPFYANTTRNILDFVIGEMEQPRGGFASALDADSQIAVGKEETSEGAFYVWSAKQVENTVGTPDNEVFGYAYGIEPNGNVPRHQDVRGELKGKNVLYEAHSTEETAKKFHISVELTAEKLTAGRKRLLAARAGRPRPPLDDKIITAWNGLLISALARASQGLDEPRYLKRAQATVQFLKASLYDPKTGKLWRSYRASAPSVDGFLDDYTDLISGLLDLYQAGFDVNWLNWAITLQEKQDHLFWDDKSGGYFDVGASDSSLLSRTREGYDGVEPAPNSTAAMNLLRLAQFTDRSDWRVKAQKTMSAFAARLQSDPEAVPALASAVDFHLAPKKQILIAGDPKSQDTRELLRQVNSRFLPNKILILADGGAGQQELARWLPFVQGARRTKDHATAYICENYVCKLPTTDPQVVARLLETAGPK